MHSLAEAGYDTISTLKAATLEDLEETGLTRAKARLILKASAQGTTLSMIPSAPICQINLRGFSPES